MMLHLLRRIRKSQIAALTMILALALWGVVFLRQAQAGRTQQHIDAGMEYARSGQSGLAEREWQEAARLSPRDPDIWELLSTLYINTEQWSKGTGALTRLLHVAPDRPYIYSRLSACALRSGNEIEAKRLALEELKRNPKDQASLHIMAFLSGMEGSGERQIAYLNQLLATMPDDAETLHSLAQAYNESGKYADVLPIVEHLIVVKPNDGFAYALRGAARFEVDASPAATVQIEADSLKALQINPLFAFARYTLGRVYMRQGQYQKAIFQLEVAQKLYRHKMDVPFDLATAYARVGQPEKAAAARQRFAALRQEATQVSVLQKRCSLDKNDFTAYLQLGQLMLQNGDQRQAGYYLQHALTLDPNDSAARKAYRQLAAQLQSGEPSPPRG